MNSKMKRKPVALLMLAALAIGLAACGRKGPLEPHPDAPPEQRARPQADAGAQGSQQSSRPALGGSRRTLSTPIKPPDKPFVLDALL